MEKSRACFPPASVSMARGSEALPTPLGSKPGIQRAKHSTLQPRARVALLTQAARA